MLAYSFASTGTSGPSLDSDELVTRLGGKGAGLATMTAAGMPVPPGFVLTTDACRRYLERGWDDEIERQLQARMAELETATGKGLGSVERPLLVSVRSGAAISMPGMMDTVLNVGMNHEVEAALADATGDAGFAADTHRRFLLQYAEIVLGASPTVVARAAEAADSMAVADSLRAAGHVVPEDPTAQVVSAVRAVFASWNGERARQYRRIEGIDGALGTAATIQAMVFGNLGPDSGTGVAFTRDPSTGRPGLTGDFLVNAQGEDVVAGDHETTDLGELATMWPDRWAELEELASTLETRYRDLVDIEFTIEQGHLWLLQARVGKRSPLAAFRIAVDMAEDPDFPLDQAEAVERCRPLLADPPESVAASDADDLVPVARGLAACPGVASGVLCIDVDEAVRLGDQGVRLVLARRQTSPADVAAMAAAAGIFTTLGGVVSHAAVVARSWGTPAVVGATEATIDDRGVTGPGGRLWVGDLVTVDGSSGLLLAGAVETTGIPAPEVLTVSRWAAHSDPGEAVADQTAGSEEASGAEGRQADEFGLLHALRIKGMGSSEVLAAMTNAEEAEVAVALASLERAGSVRYMEARDLWLITPEGRAAHEQALSERLRGVDLRPLPYEPFLAINGDFKQLCTDWQLRDGAPNDHQDDVYDQAIVERLVLLHESALPVLTQQAEVLDWLVPYQTRLTAALDRLRSGDDKALTGVMCDSYHDIWMELHEDLIVTLGIDRVAEGSG